MEKQHLAAAAGGGWLRLEAQAAAACHGAAPCAAAHSACACAHGWSPPQGHGWRGAARAHSALSTAGSHAADGDRPAGCPGGCSLACALLWVVCLYAAGRRVRPAPRFRTAACCSSIAGAWSGPMPGACCSWARAREAGRPLLPSPLRMLRLAVAAKLLRGQPADRWKPGARANGRVGGLGGRAALPAAYSLHRACACGMAPVGKRCRWPVGSSLHRLPCVGSHQADCGPGPGPRHFRLQA